MISVEHNGCLYAFKRGIDGGFWYGKRRLTWGEKGAMYPGDNCRVPLCISPKLTMAAVSAGYSTADLRRSVAPKSAVKAKAARLPKKKTNSISIF